MKEQPFLLILFVGTVLIVVGLALGMGLGTGTSNTDGPMEIIHTKPVVSAPEPVKKSNL